MVHVPHAFDDPLQIHLTLISRACSGEAPSAQTSRMHAGPNGTSSSIKQADFAFVEVSFTRAKHVCNIFMDVTLVLTLDSFSASI